MCQNKYAVIPSKYKNFYSSLPVTNTTKEDSEEEMSLQQIRKATYKEEKAPKLNCKFMFSSDNTKTNNFSTNFNF